jgi:hypothetical protein
VSLEVDDVPLFLPHFVPQLGQGDGHAELEALGCLVVKDPRLSLGSSKERCATSESTGHDLALISVPAEDGRPGPGSC